MRLPIGYKVEIIALIKINKIFNDKENEKMATNIIPMDDIKETITRVATGLTSFTVQYTFPIMKCFRCLRYYDM